MATFPPLRGGRALGGRPARGQVLNRRHEVRAFRPGDAVLAAGLAGLGNGHPEEPFGVLSTHLPVSRLVLRVATDGEDFIFSLRAAQ